MLLHNVIKQYIKIQEPIGSEYLRANLNFECKISSATIRNYFKTLCDEGFLVQAHASSGRIPTNKSLIAYWKYTLGDISSLPLRVNIDSIEKMALVNKIYCLIDSSSENLLKEVENLSGKYIVTSFTKGESILPFSKTFFKFLKDMIGLRIEDVCNFCSQVFASEIYNRIHSLKTELSKNDIRRFGSENISYLLENDASVFYSFLSGELIFKHANGIHFDNSSNANFIAIINDVLYKKGDKLENAKMLCAGSLLKDYKSFYTQIAS